MLARGAVDDPLGLHYEGAVLIHGMCEDPESTFPSDLMARFAPYGTIISASNGGFHTLLPMHTPDSKCALTCSCADGTGYRMVIQRFGGGPGDNRTSMNYTVAREDGEDGIFQELGTL